MVGAKKNLSPKAKVHRESGYSPSLAYRPRDEGRDNTVIPQRAPGRNGGLNSSWWQWQAIDPSKSTNCDLLKQETHTETNAPWPFVWRFRCWIFSGGLLVARGVIGWRNEKSATLYAGGNPSSFSLIIISQQLYVMGPSEFREG
jgi:hypothetical protein